ncbi:large ribosomal subunit protein mL65 [Phlebotomus argentipes]|uniref:large ribosomal subunit protein mL65 n=1 Tax=Phlebotomus argentipes TaxID=94469 RepID=UPI002892C668|nr:large ribosomal subunit protein mL65 [Phlebotomus argentipes]
MSLVRVNAGFSRILCQHSRLLTTSAAPANEEYVSEPQYPEILDLSFRARKYRQKQTWHDKLRRVASVEEKLLGINMPRYYGYKCVMLNDQKIPYNSLPFTQFATRTAFREADKLPDFYRRYDEAAERIAGAVQGAIEEVLEHELRGYRKAHEGRSDTLTETQKLDIVAAAIVREVNRIVMNSLSGEFPHLEELDVDLAARHEAFWVVGGINPPLMVTKMRDGLRWSKKYKDDPTDRFFQYRGTPYLALRHEHPLSPLADVLEDSSAVLEFTYDPGTIGYFHEHCHGTCIPGFWPGERREFGTLSFQTRSHFLTRSKHFGAQDDQEALHAQGITGSYAWLLAQAAYQGFNTYNELTYPLVAQTVITDGQKWSFYAYQLNTLLLHSHHIQENPRVNECWGTREEKLFDSVDDAGKLVGFNLEVLKRLVAFYCNAPAKREGEMRPYLDAKDQHVADIENVEKREWLERTFKHIMSNRPLSRQIPEIFHWERIYMIDNKKRQMDPLRKWWQLPKNPFQRRLDDHTPRYIPKVIRPGGPKSKDKFEKTHYPDC